MGMDQEMTVLSLLSSPCQSPSTCNLKIEKKTFQGPSVWNNPPTWKMLYYENKKIRFQINKSKNVMEIYMSGLTPSPLPHMMEFFFPILLDIRPFLRTLWKIFILPSEMPKLLWNPLLLLIFSTSLLSNLWHYPYIMLIWLWNCRVKI